LSDLEAAGWLHGLKLAAVAVVAQAVWGMGKKLCPDRTRISLCLGAAATLLLAPGALVQLAVIAAGGVLGTVLYREARVLDAPTPALESARARGLGAAALGLFALLLLLLPLLASMFCSRTDPCASTTRARPLAELDSFYRAGALVFGGGHVVLPLLRAELVPRAWLSDDQFLAGYGAAQALPGPLFTFAAYLGAAMHPGPLRWLHGVACLIAIFLPAWLLIGGALPFWQRLRRARWAQAALAGANASVVGVLLSALYSPVIVQGVHGAADVAAALLAFSLLEHWRVAPWLVVLGMAAAGQWVLPH
jgi:chromate transporter